MRLLEKEVRLAESVSISAAILADVMKDILSVSYHAILLEEKTQRSSKRMDEIFIQWYPLHIKRLILDNCGCVIYPNYFSSSI